MRIGMIMDTPFPPDARVENEAITLVDNGYEVYLFHIDYEGRPAREEYEGVQIYRVKGSRFLYKMSALAYTVPYFRWSVQGEIRRFIQETGVDVLHIHDMVIAEAAFKANKVAGLPTVLDLHENRPEIMQLYNHTNSWPGNRLINLNRWKTKQKELMNRAGQVILVSEEARKYAQRVDGIPLKKTVSVPNVVSLDRFDTGCRDEELEEITRGKCSLLYIGDTSLRRGTMTILEMCYLMQNHSIDLQVIFVGESSQDNHLKAFVKQRGLESVVQFEGWQKPEKLPAYINAADICLSPLLRNPHHDTTYANKLFQYMACGKPVVASDCPAQAAVVNQEKCGVVFEAGNSAELAKVVVDLYKNPKQRKWMGKNGATAVRERWNWNVTGKNLLGVYEELSTAQKVSDG